MNRPRWRQSAVSFWRYGGEWRAHQSLGCEQLRRANQFIVAAREQENGYLDGCEIDWLSQSLKFPGGDLVFVLVKPLHDF